MVNLIHQHLNKWNKVFELLLWFNQRADRHQYVHENLWCIFHIQQLFESINLILAHWLNLWIMTPDHLHIDSFLNFCSYRINRRLIVGLFSLELIKWLELQLYEFLECINRSTKLFTFFLHGFDLIVLVNCIDKICKSICIILVIHVKVGLKYHQLIQGIDHLLYSFIFTLHKILVNVTHFFVIRELEIVHLIDCWF